MNSLEIYDGVVSKPGKFEGEPAFTSYFWDSMLDGCEDDTAHDCDDDIPISIFHIMPEDGARFPDRVGCADVWIWEDDNGFVYHSLVKR